MFRAQSLIDERRQGLEERPESLFAPTDAPLSALSLPDDDDVADMSGLDLEAMALELEIACHHASIIERAAMSHGVLPSIIAGFCSRRSGWGQDLSPAQPDGTRDFQARALIAGKRRSSLPADGLGYERGLMALDYDLHPLAQETLWRDPASNLDVAFALIAAHRTSLRRRTTLQGRGLLRASFTAFECGLDAVERVIRLGLDVDSATPGWSCGARGCGRDVLARAAFFQSEGWD